MSRAVAKLTNDYSKRSAVTQPLLVKMYGRTAGMLLHKIHYWSEKKEGTEINGERWVFNTAEEWADQVYVSPRQIKRTVSTLLEAGVIKIAKLHKNKWNRTNFYTIDYELLLKRISEFCNSNRPTKETPVAEQSKTPHMAEQAQSLDTAKELQTFVTESAEVKAPANTTVQDMVRVWNECLGEKAQAKLNLEVSPLLVSAFKNKFGSSLGEWRNYCEQLKSSSYIMGKAFNLSINWALKFSTIDRIRGGWLGVVRTSQSNETEHSVNDEKAKLENELNGTVKAVKLHILEKVENNEFRSYFTPSTFEEMNGKVIITAANAFAQRQLNDKYGYLVDSVKTTCCVDLVFAA